LYYISLCDLYIICWFDDSEVDLDKAGRRLIGGSFPLEVTCDADEMGKKTFNANFNTEHGKLA
jgi:hypothetical protein